MQLLSHNQDSSSSGQNSPATKVPCTREVRTLFGMPIKLSAQTITLAFTIFGIAWILISTILLEQQHDTSTSHTTFHLANGLLFVILTALLLYLLVRRYTTDLFFSRELINRVFEASPSGIAVFSTVDQSILLANRQFADLVGYSEKDLKGRSDRELKLWENGEERLVLLDKLNREGAAERFEATFRHSDGTQFSGSVTARRIVFDGLPCTITFLDDTTDQKQIARQVEELTRYDAMTGLPNQKLLTERLNQLLTINSRDEQGLSVLTLALGRCPGSISARGHDGCDELLRCVAQRLRSVLRETETLAVLQKGEFAILFPRAESERDLLPAVTKLLDCINEPFKLDESEFQLHAHIGVAVFPGDGRTSDVLLQHAHLAMTQAQTCIGESFFRFYAAEMNRLAEEQLQVEASILRGIKTGEFFLCYQPLFDQTGKQLVSMEALARWQHPTLGLVGPDTFIPVAEANGAIVALGDLVLDLAVRNCQHWRDNGHPHLSVAVNVSARQLKDRQFHSRVSQSLQNSGLPPAALCCELTESMLMEHSNENIEQLFKLKKLGVKLAIDDFGTGYSSLAHLKHLPVDTIKIDRSFVRDLESNPDDKAIVSAIVAMAHSLNLQVVAEGVETERQLQMLQESGCDLMQGFYFGKPMERDRFDQYLAQADAGALFLPLTPQLEPSKAQHEPMITVLHGDERALQTVADITAAISPLQPGDSLNTVLERFQTDKGLQVLPVVDQQKVVGILNRSEFIEEQIVGRIGYAFHINHSKKVRALMQPVPLIMESETSIEEAAQAMQGKFGTLRLENICVARRGIYQGILDVRTLVEAITALNLKLAKGANPLTGLPGNESIQREITRRIESGNPFDIAYIDIDHFKPYNDSYGFERGDMVIQVVGEILKTHTGGPGSQIRNFCGHIGGDDFIIITGPGHAAALSRQLIAEFEARLPVLHGSSDYAKGFYTSFNRKGELETFSLLSLSTAIITTGQLQISSYAQLASMASEVKKTAKKVKGSSVVVKDSMNQPNVLLGSASPTTSAATVLSSIACST